jgi:hypothetical protein
MNIQQYILYVLEKFLTLFDSSITIKSGNTGINQPNPSAKLHVTGTARVNKLEVYDTNETTLREFIDHNGFKQIRYRDEYVGTDWINPLGGPAPDDVNATIGGVVTRVQSYDGGTTEERKGNSFEIPHDLALDEVNAGTEFIEWHVHYMPSTNDAGDIKWFLDYCYIPPFGAAIPQTAAFTVDTINANEQYVHKITGVQLPAPAGGFGIGGIILFNLRRTPTDTDDTYAADALLIKTALHVPINDFGSRQRYIK